MRAKSMVLILIALGCGLVATIGVSQVMKDRSADTVMEPIVVTISEVDINQALTPEITKLEQWPQEKIPPGAITNLEELEGKYAGQRMFPGEPVLVSKLTDSNTNNEAVNIPPGFRVSAVKVSEDTVAGNLISPGDRVDVIAYIKAQGQTVRTKTILSDIVVFAVNSQTSRNNDVGGGEERIHAKTVSLLVKPKQVQMLVMAEQLGEIELSLRHPDDKKQENIEDTTLETLLGESGTPNRDGRGGGGLLSMIQSTMIARAAPAEELFRMEILTPQSVATWQWEDETKLPQLVGELANGSPSDGGPPAPQSMPATPNPAPAAQPPADGGVPIPVAPVPPAFTNDV